MYYYKGFDLKSGQHIEKTFENKDEAIDFARANAFKYLKYSIKDEDGEIVDGMSPGEGFDENYLRNRANIIANENQIASEERELFIEIYIEFLINDDEKNEEEKEENFKWGENIVIASFNKFINAYKEALSINHSVEWAKEYARNVSFHDDNIYVAMRGAYEFIREKYGCSLSDKENNLVYEEAYRGCKSEGKSDLYCELFSDRIMTAEPLEDAVRYATDYENALNEKIALGKTKLFAQLYAYEIANENCEVYSEWYATKYETAIDKGKSENYAHVYAEMFAEEYNDKYLRVEEMDDDYVYYLEDKAFSYAEGLEIAAVNNFSLPVEFAKIYQHNYLNRYPDNDADSFRNKSEEEILMIILQKSFEEYKKRISK